MTLTIVCHNILSQLTSFVEQIHESDFSKPSEILGKSTVGQHLRHTLEFFICFEKGFEKGIINYDKRSHDKLIESDKLIALAALNHIAPFIESLTTDKALKLEVGYDLNKDEFLTIDTTATRELVYNIEHAVHHMAIIKIGLREIAPYVTLSSEFGVAASTIRYNESTVLSSH